MFKAKFVKFLKSVFKWQVNSSSSFASLFIVTRHNSSLNFKLIHFLIKIPILTLSSALVKICQISHVIFQTTSQFFFKFCITLQCHERWLLYTVLAQTYTLVTRSPLKPKFLDFQVLGSKFIKFLMSIFKRQVNSSSDFASFFIVVIHNFSLNFNLILFLLWIKRSYQSPNFETFNCSGVYLPYSSCHFPNHKSVFLQIFHHSPVSWKITPLYIFRSNIKYFAQ